MKWYARLEKTKRPIQISDGVPYTFETEDEAQTFIQTWYGALALTLGTLRAVKREELEHETH